MVTETKMVRKTFPYKGIDVIILRNFESTKEKESMWDEITKHAQTFNLNDLPN